MDTTPATRSRRSLLAAAAAAGGALATSALVRPNPVSAANVVLGVVNTANAVTTIRNTQASNGAKAIVGLVTYTGPGGPTVGVQGQSNAANGTGVFGVAAVGGSRGVWGRSATGIGVFGEATGTSGVNVGVKGVSKSVGPGVGVLGTGNTGVRGEGASVGVSANGHDYAVYAISDFFGVVASGPGNSGVFGSGRTGVFGSGDDYGVFGNSVKTGVYGHGLLYAVRGEGGPYGAYLTGTSYGLYAGSANYAAWLNGKVHVSGTLTKTGGSFLIDHPLDPANRTLEHSFVEAPERLNVYRGNVTLDRRGRATVRMPRYFRALNTDYSYQLTAVGAPAPHLHVARPIERSSFAIAGGLPGQVVCWQVTGIRQDAWAKAHPLRVERLKRRKDRGRFLNPEVQGQPASAAIGRPPKVDGQRPQAPRLPGIDRTRTR